MPYRLSMGGPAEIGFLLPRGYSPRAPILKACRKYLHATSMSPDGRLSNTREDGGVGRTGDRHPRGAAVGLA